MRARLAAIALSAALLSACGGEGAEIDPAPRPEGPPAATPPATTTATPPIAGALPRKRTVMTRSPLGGPPDNLFIDGDFELSTVPDGYIPQLAWLGFTEAGAQLAVKAETGGLCRTGLRCGVLEASHVLLARGAAANHDAGHVASVWAKLPSGAACDTIRALLVDCDTFQSSKKLKADDAPDAGGWCSYGATLSARENSVCLYLDSTLKSAETALIDAAVLVPDDGTMTARALEFWVPPPEVASRLAAIGETLRKRMGDPPERASLPD